MPDIKISISTEAELAAAKALEGQLERSIAKAKILGTGYEDLTAKIKGMKERVTQLQQTQESLNQSHAKGGVAADAIADKIGRKLFSAASIATVALRGLNFVVGAMKPLFSGVSSEMDRLQGNLGALITQSKEGQFLVKPWQTILETLNNALESRLIPNIGAMAGKVRAGTEAMSDAKRIVGELRAEEEKLADAVNSGAKVYGNRGQALKGAIGDRVDLLEEQRRLALAKADREQDPVKRERLKAGIDIAFDAKKQTVERAGRSEQLKNIDLELALQNQTLATAKGAIPSREELVAKLLPAQKASEARKAAQAENRSAFADSERLRLAESNPWDLSEADRDALIESGALMRDDRDGAFHVIPAAFRAQKEAAATRLLGTRANLANTTAAENAAISALPSGVGSEADIDNLIQGKTANFNSIRNQVGERKFELFKQQDQIFKEDRHSQEVFSVRQQTSSVETLNRAEVLAGQNQDATHSASGRLANTIETTGGVVNSMISQLQVYEAQMRTAQERIRTLEQRGARDPQ